VTLNQTVMPAVRLLRWQSEPELVAVQVPEPGPGEVLLKVDAGLRHSDLYLTDWPAGTAPCTLPPHAGTRDRRHGRGARPRRRRVREGDRVLVHARWGCGACWPCLQGGAISYVGRGGGSLPVSPASLPFGCSVHIPTWGTLPELAEVVALAQTGGVRTKVECFTIGQAVNATGGCAAARCAAVPWLRRMPVIHPTWHQLAAMRILKIYP
jgi:D-arabinose 1-dehydrogenase-like Zn-dependent alcohol dehydrogenase